MSEQLPPAEHWQGHIDVPRPEPSRGIPRVFFLVLLAALAVGLLTLGVLAFWSQQADSPNVFAWGVVVISITCVVVVAAFVLPLPMAFNSQWVTGFNLWGPEPLPLVTPAAAMVAFSAPSIVALVVLILKAW